MEKLKKYILPAIAIILFILICAELILLGQYYYYNYIEEKPVPASTFSIAMEQKKQQLEIPLAFECQPNVICFEFKASYYNDMAMLVNQNCLRLYINNTLKSLSYWDGNKSGLACLDNKNKLQVGESCFGKVELTNETCKAGEVLSLKVVHDWGAKRTVSVNCN